MAFLKSFFTAKPAISLPVPVLTPVQATSTPPQAPVAVPNPKPMPTPTHSDILYQTAAGCLGTHQTLNPSVPNDVGCAEAWSSVAKKAGVLDIPATGIAGTANLYLWLTSNPAFKRVTSPLPGDTIISPTGYGNGSVEGHVGFIAKSGILSNNSDNGLFQEKWTLPAWNAHYGVAGELPVAFFRWV